jgi:heparosan-N-sulfate-glucuronate 5-epimerase
MKKWSTGKIIKKSIIAAGLVLGLAIFPVINEAATSNFASYITNGKVAYAKGNYTYKPYLQNYSPSGDYLNSSSKDYSEILGRLKYDSKSIPMVNYYGKYYYNPVTISNIALTEYGIYTRTKKLVNKQQFLTLADGLIRLQSKDGSFRYNFTFYKPELENAVLKPGWVSAMAQGEALSVYSRAYRLTGNIKYLNAGTASLHLLQVPKAKGGVMTDLGDINPKLKNYIWFEEYVTPTNNYTLNGFMFTILGLYDWSKLNVEKKYGSSRANLLFTGSIKSLEQVLGKYDLGGFTMYDLSYYTMKTKIPHIVPEYHAIYIYQLQSLYSITGDKYLLDKSRLWASYVKQ